MVCPLRKITPQTTASSNRDENIHASHSATEGVSKPKTEDFNQLNEMCWNAFFNAKTMKSIRSSFCSFTRLKLQNEDLRQNALFDAEILKSMGSSCCSFAYLKLQNEG